MKTRILALTLVLISVAAAPAQQLYMPRNVAGAYGKGTRSADGKPGPKYWQNKGVYSISIRVAAPGRTVNGTEEILYTNNSPDMLGVLAFRVDMNVHMPEAAREGPTRTEYLTSGVQIDEYTENGKVREWHDRKGSTIQFLRPEKEIGPGETIKLGFKWHYDLASHTAATGGREGAIDDTSYFLAYFYPRVSVYDDTDGWDFGQFTEGHEFYNDFNDYTLQVTAPKNFVVWATGDLQNPDEVLRPEIAARLKTSMTSDDVIHVATLKELTDKVVTQQSDTLRWKFKADNVSDVAAGVSDHYIWDAGSVVVDKTTGRRASVQAAYDEPSKDFQKMVEYAKHALDWCSNNYPGIPYPYSKTTVFRGHADMEYPMMVNDSSQKDATFARFVVEHEILHTWFPFYMGINERRYGFMDEGWTTAFELKIGTADVGKERAEEAFKQFRVEKWANSADSDSDLPIIMPGDVMGGNGFFTNEYGKSALAYHALIDLLGEAEFKRVLKQFMADWNGKHTLPWDMFYSFNRISGKDLNWFFRNWFFEPNYIDTALTSLTPTDDGYSLVLTNVGGFAVPMDINIEYTDGSEETLHQTPAIWASNRKSATVKIPTTKKIKSVIAAASNIFVEHDRSDNVWGIELGGLPRTKEKRRAE